MRVFTYVPEVDNSDQITSLIDRSLPEGQFEVEYATDLEDLSKLAKYYDDYSILVFVDGKQHDPFRALAQLKNIELKGPLVCLYQNGNNTTLFNALTQGAISATEFNEETFQSKSLPLLLGNAQLGYQGRSNIKEFGTIKIDYDSKIVSVNEQPINLTGKEFSLLKYLTTSEGQTKSKEQIFDNFYALGDGEVEIKIIDVFICKLRDKLNTAQPGLGLSIETIWGRGYRFITDPDKNKNYIKQFGNLEFDFTDLEIRIDGKSVDLTITEFMVLKTFATNYPNPVTQKELVKAASQFGRDANDETIGRVLYSMGRKLESYGPEYKKLIVPTSESEYIINLSQVDEKAAQKIKQDTTALGSFKLNKTLREASFKNNPLDLTEREFNILEIFIDDFPESITGKKLAEKIYGAENKTGTLNIPLNSLRAKIRDANNGIDRIINKRGLGYHLDIHSERALKKFQDAIKSYKIGPWTLDVTRNKISYLESLEDGSTNTHNINLNRSQFLVLKTMLLSYPSAASRTDMLQAIYGEEFQDKAENLNQLFSQTKTSVRQQLGEYLGGMRKIKDKVFRIDLDIDDMPESALEASKITDIGAWTVNHTAHMVLFDGDPIEVTDNEFHLMESLAKAYPNAITAHELAEKTFNDSTASQNQCMTLFRKKLREDYGVTELPFINKRNVGYILNADRQELLQDQLDNFETTSLGDVEINYSLGQIVSGNKITELNAAEFFALKQITDSDLPITAKEISKKSRETDYFLEELTVKTAVRSLNDKLDEAGVTKNLLDENKRLGYFLATKREAIVANSNIQQVGKIRINHTLEELIYMMRTIPLTRSEFILLKTMSESPQIPLSLEDMSHLITDEGDPASDVTLTASKSNINRKVLAAGIKEDDSNIISNKSGVGYYFTHMQDRLELTRINGKRNTTLTDSTTIQVGELKINTINDTVIYKDNNLDTISGKPLDLLILMANQHQNLVSYADISNHFFGDKSSDNIKRARMGVESLRHMMNKAASELGDTLIREVVGHGYTLALETSDYRAVLKKTRTPSTTKITPVPTVNPKPIISNDKPHSPIDEKFKETEFTAQERGFLPVISGNTSSVKTHQLFNFASGVLEKGPLIWFSKHYLRAKGQRSSLADLERETGMKGSNLREELRNSFSTLKTAAIRQGRPDILDHPLLASNQNQEMRQRR